MMNKIVKIAMIIGLIIVAYFAYQKIRSMMGMYMAGKATSEVSGKMNDMMAE